MADYIENKVADGEGPLYENIFAAVDRLVAARGKGLYVAARAVVAARYDPDGSWDELKTAIDELAKVVGPT